MGSSNKLAALNKFRSVGTNALRPTSIKVLVVYDVQVKTPEVSQVPLVVNYGEGPVLLRIRGQLTRPLDLPKAVEEYAHRLVVPHSFEIDRG